MEKDVKQFIKENYQSLSAEQIAAKLNIKKRKIEKYINSLKERKPSGTSTSQASTLFPEKNLWISLAGIVIVGFLIYANSLNASFQFDDFHFIVNNPTIKDINNLFLFDRLSVSLSVRWIGFLSFALNYQLHQLDVFGYHLFNLTVHIVNGILVFWLAFLTLNTPKLHISRLSGYKTAFPLIVALLFVAHPLQTEAVTYICQRFASLATLFYLFSVCLYSAGRLSKGTRAVMFFAGSLVCAVLGMFTKQITFTLPAIILFYELMFFEHKKGGKEKQIFIAVVFLLALLIIPSIYSYDFGILTAEGHSHSHDGDYLNNWVYLLTQFRVIATYLRLLIWPAGQNLDYDFPASFSLLEPKTLFSLLLLLALLTIAATLFKKHRLISFGIFWFFICLSVESSIIVIAHVIFEHRVYLPSIGFAFVAASLLCQLTNNKKMLVGACSIIIAALSVLTVLRNNVWQTEISLWQDVIKKSPSKYRGYYSLGMAYGKAGDKEKMIEYFKKGLEVAPNNAKAYNNLGIAYSKIDRAKATDYFEKTVATDPDFVEGYTNLGAMYAAAGKEDEAASVFQKAIELNPGYAAGYNNLGTILMRQGRLADAKRYFEKAISLNKDYRDAHANLSEIRKILKTKEVR